MWHPGGQGPFFSMDGQDCGGAVLSSTLLTSAFRPMMPTSKSIPTHQLTRTNTSLIKQSGPWARHFPGRAFLYWQGPLGKMGGNLFPKAGLKETSLRGVGFWTGLPTVAATHCLDACFAACLHLEEV